MVGRDVISSTSSDFDSNTTTNTAHKHGELLPNQTDKNPQKGIRKASAKVTQPYKKMEQAVFNDQKKEWSVEGVKDGNITLDQIEEKHAVCISECQDTIVQIKGKVNHILLLNCKKVGLVFDSVVTSVEVMRCQSLKVQVQFSDVRRKVQNF